MPCPRRYGRFGKMQPAPFVRRCLAGYAANLIGEIEMNEDFLTMLIRLLTENQRARLKNWLSSKSPREKEYHPLYLRFGVDKRRAAAELWNDLQDGTLSTTEKELEMFLLAMLKEQPGKDRCREVGERFRELDELQSVFNLTGEEKTLVLLFYCAQCDENFQEMLDTARTADFVRIAAAATRLPLRRVKSALSEKGNLIKKGLFVRFRKSGAPCSSYRILAEVSDFLSGVSDMPIKERLIKEEKAGRFDLASFNVPSAATTIVLSLLRSGKPCHLLLYGRPGTGKTEYAKAAAAAAGARPYFFRRGDTTRAEAPECNTEFANIRAALNLVPAGGVLIVDEADSLLNNRYFTFGLNNTPDKSQVNALLDQAGSKIVWITNDIHYIEESILRRFAYSVKFAGFSRLARERIWRGLAVRHRLRKFITPPLIRDLAARYPCNAAGIASALESLKAVARAVQINAGDVRTTLEELLRQHTELTGNRPVSALNLLAGHYDPRLLNMDAPFEAVLKSLRDFANFKQSAPGRDGNINILFWGGPGTGKTEFAKYLASEIQMELILKRASDLISMWVGQTEQNIRNAFAEAEKDNAILLIDEADSFFINRHTAVRSWEVTQTNELLTQMENHKGILICCTNMPGHLDNAVMRRFAWKIHFKPLTDEGKIKMFAAFFPQIALDENAVRKIQAIPGLTPGQIKAVWQKIRFLDAFQTQAEAIITELEKEAQYENGGSNPIGFRQ